MAAPAVRLTVPLMEGAMLRTFTTGWFCEDGFCRYICVIFQAFLEPDGSWVMGFYDTHDSERRDAIQGKSIAECDGFRLVWGRMAAVSSGE